MTYRGHAVLRTLIRCHFSPAATTDQRYVYSGSSDGKIHVRSNASPPSSLGADLANLASRLATLTDLVPRRPGRPNP